MNYRLPETLIAECKTKLLARKTELMNRVRAARKDFEDLDKGTDEADQSMTILAENEYLAAHVLITNQLMEIDLALSRIEQGRYGICEETDEPIEPERLRAIPWTRVSIEGAEIREAMGKRYAR